MRLLTLPIAWTIRPSVAGRAAGARRPTRRAAPLAPVLFALFAGVHAAQAASAVAVGDLAAPGRWLAPAGAAAHTGASAAPPLWREPEVAWEVRLRGAIEGEPSTWDGSVIVSVEESPGRRALQVLELASGRTLLHQVLSAEQPLDPVVWGDVVAVRPAPDRLDVYQMRGGRLLHARTLRGQRTVGPPLLVEGELYVHVDDRLRRYDLDRSAPVWEAPATERYRGRPALSGGGLFSLAYDARGTASIACLDRGSGRVLSRTEVGHHGGEVPAADEPGDLFVFPERVFVRYPRPVPSTTGRTLFYGRLERQGLQLAGELASLQELRLPPLAWRDGWVALEGGEEDGRWLWARESERGIGQLVLADASHHADLVAAAAPASRTGPVLYLGGLAAELETGRILWRRAAPRFRAVPADGYLLVVEQEHALTALREPEPVRSEAERRAGEDLERESADLARGLAALAQRSVRLGDAAITRRLLQEALRRGATGRIVQDAYAALDRLGAASRPVDPRSSLARGLAREEDALRRQPEERLYAEARRARAPALERAYLRAVLALNPAHAEAHQSIRRMVPEHAPLTQPFPGVSWLDFLDVHARTPVICLNGQAETRGFAETRLLEEERARWRSDLIGYRSERLFVITPPGRPGAVARCLEVGELVCDLLEEIFPAADGRPAGRAPEPMVLLLYGDQAEYVSRSRADGSGPESGLDWTAGHYSSLDNKSRMFVPGNDRDLRGLLGVYAHELCHHWLATRAPFASRIADGTQPFWIVEGFARLVEEFRLDPGSGTWEAHNPRAASLDVLAGIDASELLPWSRVLSMDHAGFSRLAKDARVEVPLHWHLGLRKQQSDVQLFYAQAGALAHYLFASSPENRRRLTDYVRSWYLRERSALDAGRAFGLTPEALGERALAHARRAVQG